VADFKVDTDELRTAAGVLKGIASEFANANENVEPTAVAVGDDDLAHAVRKFALSWNQHREELTDQLKKLRTHLTNAADNIDATDQALADNVEG
jgi:uncharacterized protein YukE